MQQPRRSLEHAWMSAMTAFWVRPSRDLREAVRTTLQAFRCLSCANSNNKIVKFQLTNSTSAPDSIIRVLSTLSCRGTPIPWIGLGILSWRSALFLDLIESAGRGTSTTVVTLQASPHG
jgi:hypothetical protein